MNDSLRNMLNTIGEISKKTQNFNELGELFPLLNELRRSDIDNKEITQYLKLTSELFPKLKAKILQSTRGDSVFDVYDRMANQINFQINRLHAEFQEVSSNISKADKNSEDQIKTETTVIIKDIQQILATNKKSVLNLINIKKKQYLLNNDSREYLKKRLIEKINEKGQRKSLLQHCKSQLGQYRCVYSLYQTQNRSKQVKAQLQKIRYGKETGMNEEVLTKSQKLIELQKRKQFLTKSQEHIERQTYFVLSNIRKFDLVRIPGQYEEKLFFHYLTWAKRLKILIESVLIKLSIFDRNRLNIKQQQSFLQEGRQMQQKCQKLLQELQNILK